MSENHTHSHNPSDKKGLIISIILNSVIVLTKFIWWIIANSLTLISDAIHDLTDVFSLVLAYVGEVLWKKDSNDKHTFAFKRAEVIIAFVNSLALILIGIYIMYEAISKYFHPQIEIINGGLMLIIAIIWFFWNFISVLFLHWEKDENLNKKAAYLHILSDVVASIIVLISWIVIYYTKWYMADLISSFIIAIFIIKFAWGLLKSSLHILMQWVPEMLDNKNIVNNLSKIPWVKELHNTHIWNIDSNEIFFSSHIVIEKNISSDNLLNTINNFLHKNYEIDYTNLQLETRACNKTY